MAVVKTLLKYLGYTVWFVAALVVFLYLTLPLDQLESYLVRKAADGMVVVRAPLKRCGDPVDGVLHTNAVECIAGEVVRAVLFGKFTVSVLPELADDFAGRHPLGSPQQRLRAKFVVGDQRRDRIPFFAVIDL